MKRILSVFLIACLMLTMLVVSVPAVADGGPYTITFVQSGKTIAPASYNEGAEIVYPAIDGTPNRQGDWVWSLNETTFEAVPTVMPAENITVYAVVREGFFNFENYYRNEWIVLSGRVQPVEIDGNTVIKYDNYGIPLATKPKKFGSDANFYTKSGSKYTQYNKSTAEFEPGKYYHASATLSNFDEKTNTMEAYNAIDLGQIKAGKSYAITFSYKVESIVSKVKVEPTISCLSANAGRKLVSEGGLVTRYSDSIKTLDSVTNKWVTVTTYITAPATIPTSADGVGDQLRLNIYTGYANEKTVVYFDNITVREFVGANLVYNYANGQKTTVQVEVGTNINYVGITANRNGDMAWSASKDAYIAPEKVMPNGEYNVYEYLREGFFGFENYYRNKYIVLSGRVQPVKLEDGNTVVKFDNKGIPLAEKRKEFGTDTNFYTKSGSIYTKYDMNNDVFEPGKYYHASAAMAGNDKSVDMDTYNAIELGQIEDGAVYKITVNYKRQNVVSPVTVSPRSWNISANIDRRYQIIYDSKIVIPATDTPDSEWQTEVLYISAVTSTDASTYEFDQLRLVVYTPNEIDIDNVIYFDDINVEKITAPYILFNANNGETPILERGEVGDAIVPPTVTLDNKDFVGWFTDKDCTTPFTLDKFAADTAITVYAGWKNTSTMVYDFENYKPNDYISISGRVQPVKEANGNTVIKFDNKGIALEKKPFNWGVDQYFYTKEYVNGEAVYTKYDKANAVFEPGKYYHSSATINAVDSTKGMEQYNAIELAQINEGTIYQITIKYKREKVITPVTISPRSWNNSANVRTGMIVYDGKVTIPATNTPDKEWQTVTTSIMARTTNGDITDLDRLRLVIYSAGIVDEDNVVYFDDIIVEEITAPYILFDGQNKLSPVIVKGKEGETIVAPKVTHYGKSFNGWFTDKECTKRFTQKTFKSDTAITVYAGWVENRVRRYSFENYNIPVSGNGDFRRIDGKVVATKDAFDGNNVMEFDRRIEGQFNSGRSLVAVAEGDIQCDLNPKNNYVVTVYYKIVEKQLKTNLILQLTTAKHNNYVNNSYTIQSPGMSKYRDITSSEWMRAVFYIKGSEIKEDGNYLYLRVQGQPHLLWVDEITVTALKPGESAVIVDSGGSKTISNTSTATLIGRKGESYANKLPKNPVLSGKQFIGYYTKDSQGFYNPLAEADMKFDDTVYTIYARFVDKKVYQNFEDPLYHDFVNGYDFTGPLNYDYELYDSRAAGNSKSNVTSGRYSLHRKGKSLYLENAQLLRLGNTIAEGQRYTVSMKVKLGEHKHTNGAVKIASCRNYYMTWDTTGDYYAVVPIADLKEGEWVEVSYTFNSVEPYVSIQTPGYVELFIDDIVFTLAGKDTPLSTSAAYTEYVQAILDENGEFIIEEGNGIDISSIIDASLTVGGQEDLSMTTIILICAIGGGVVLLLIALAVVLILVKRKKKKVKA